MEAVDLEHGTGWCVAHKPSSYAVYVTGRGRGIAEPLVRTVYHQPWIDNIWQSAHLRQTTAPAIPVDLEGGDACGSRQP